jgi:hypothetical protein
MYGTQKLIETCFYLIAINFSYNQCIRFAVNARSVQLMSDTQANNELIGYIIHNLDRISISKEHDCEVQLKNETNQTWTCSVEYNNEIETPAFCYCSRDYDCKQEELIYMTKKYAFNIRRRNKLNNIDRGADYQCELILNESLDGNKQPWTCEMYRKVSDIGEVYCRCTSHKTCQQERIVDFY